MKSYFITLGMLLSITYCQAAILDYSNITPWRIAYAVYPVYEPESWVDVWKNERSPDSWVQVWKNERSWDVFDDTVLNVGFNNDHRHQNNVNRRTAGDVGDSIKNSQPERSTDDQNLKSKQLPTHPWPKNYKDWPKNVKKDHSTV